MRLRVGCQYWLLVTMMVATVHVDCGGTAGMFGSPYFTSILFLFYQFEWPAWMASPLFSFSLVCSFARHDTLISISFFKARRVYEDDRV